MKAHHDPLFQLCLRRIKAVTDKVRWKVIEMLMDGPKTAGELARELGVEQSLLSHHLKILRHEGFIESWREGKSVICKLTGAIEFSDKGWELDLGCCRLHKAANANTPLMPTSLPSLEPVCLDTQDKFSANNRLETKIEATAKKPLISRGGGDKIVNKYPFCQLIILNRGGTITNSTEPGGSFGQDIDRSKLDLFIRSMKAPKGGHKR
ncbi:MAG: metalloregulator ArsR/SmtB family transcription factor [Syntrophobacterales bacterium]|jgi:ArsR family transcriptional regulator|nr:metalloregulator ArsR/SmtB family transcription factor [Syntrophobacterales bacterium]